MKQPRCIGIGIWYIARRRSCQKLPCHIRTHLESWERNQRAKEAFQRTKAGRERLEELNAIGLLEASQEEQAGSSSPDPPANSAAPEPARLQPNQPAAQSLQHNVPRQNQQPSQAHRLPPPSFGHMYGAIPYPPALPLPPPRALHAAPYVTVVDSFIGERSSIGNLPGGRKRKRAPRRCMTCFAGQALENAHTS